LKRINDDTVIAD